MNSYLDIARAVLRDARRPLTGKEMLNLAFAKRLVPPQLYGKTQHKTLQARLSEDILKRRENSQFFRTSPGRFFLREFIDDDSIPEEFRTPIAARRRTRDLLKSPALAVRTSILNKIGARTPSVSAEYFLNAIDQEYAYIDPKSEATDYALVWAVASVVKQNTVLCYRVGRYRDDRDAFANKRSITFSSLVGDLDYSLFSGDRLGIEESALRAAVDDLDIPVRPTAHLGGNFHHKIGNIVPFADEHNRLILLAHVAVECPTWFEPVRRRLSLNDVQWLDISVAPNNLDDFDPWSRILISNLVANKNWTLAATNGVSDSPPKRG